MSYVDVMNARLKSQGCQRVQTANTQQIFLLQPHLAIATVKLIGDVLIYLLSIGCNICIE